VGVEERVGDGAPHVHLRGVVVQDVRMLGAEEVKSLIAEQGHVELTCEFCNRTFRYDEQATQAILREGVQSSVLH